MRYSIILSLCLLVFSSALGQQPIDVHNFKKTLNLEDHLKPIEVQDEILLAHAMASDGEHILVLNDKEVPPIKAYRLKDGKYMGGFGSIGGGPGEFNMINGSSFGVRKGQIIVQGQKYLRIYNIKPDANKIDFQLASETKIPVELGIINRGFLLEDDVYAASIMGSPKNFVSFKISSPNLPQMEVQTSINDFGDYPNSYPDIPSTAYHHLYTGSLDYDYDGETLVVAYGKVPQIRVFDLPSGLFRDIEIKPNHQQIEKLIPDPRGRSIANGIEMTGYQSRVKIGRNFIVTEYQESKSEKTATSAMGNMRTVPLTDKMFLVFNKKGELIIKLTPPEWFEKYIITPDDRMILFHPEIADQLFVLDLNQFI